MTFSGSAYSERALGELSGSTGAATSITLGGATTGYLGAPANFSAGADGTITGTVVVTPSDSGGGGTFSPTSVNITNGSPTASFTYTPGSVGAKSISVTNNGGLANPPALPFTSVTNLPGKPTSVAATPGDTSATVAFTPGDTGGSPVTYTVTASPGGASNTGSASPIIVPGLTNGTAYTFTVSPANTNGTGTLSDPSNSVTPVSMVTACKLAPFVDSDALSTVAAQAYANVSGTMTAVGSPPTVNTVTSIANGRQVLIAAPPNNADGSFRGVIRWATGNGEFFVDELNIPSLSLQQALGNRTITKVCNLPFGTDVSGAVGYQLYDSTGAAVGGLVTSGILTVPGAANTDKLCSDITRPAGWSGYVRWTNGSGVYSVDEVQMPGSAQATSTKTVTVTLTTNGSTPAANVAGLKWVWRDSFGGAILSQGTGASTNGSGVFSVPVITTLATGGIGWLDVNDSDGTLGQSPMKGYSGPAQVA